MNRILRGLTIGLLLMAGRSYAQSNPNVVITGTIQGANGLPASNTLLSFTPTQTFYVATGDGPPPSSGGCGNGSTGQICFFTGTNASAGDPLFSDEGAGTVAQGDGGLVYTGNGFHGITTNGGNYTWATTTSALSTGIVPSGFNITLGDDFSNNAAALFTVAAHSNGSNAGSISLSALGDDGSTNAGNVTLSATGNGENSGNVSLVASSTGSPNSTGMVTIGATGEIDIHSSDDVNIAASGNVNLGATHININSTDITYPGSGTTALCVDPSGNMGTFGCGGGGAITLTTNAGSGVATLTGTVLNIPPLYTGSLTATDIVVVNGAGDGFVDSGQLLSGVTFTNTSNQFGNFNQNFGLSGSGTTRVSNIGIVGINPSLATTYTITNATGAAVFTTLTDSGLTAGECVQASTGGLLVTTGSACGSGGGGSAFSAITSGVNAGAAMVVNTGASLNFSGSGTINASSVGGVALSGLCQTGGAGCPAGGSSAFSAITSSTNTTAAMVVGAGASLNFTSSGTINASSVGGVALSGLCQTGGTGCPQPALTKAAVSHNFLTSYTSTTGLFTAAQPAFTDISGQATNAQLATQTANTVLGALTATTPSGLAVPSCSAATSALTWTSGTGFGCHTLGNTTSTSLTTNKLPKANGANSIIDSALSDDGTTLIYAGSGSVSSFQLGTNVFSALPTCNSGAEGTVAPVTDSTTNTWGATITGGSTNHVQAYCDGTNWTVAAK